jgi:mannose-6-phosphate isomerase-like protein (cupin superfamily)
MKCPSKPLVYGDQHSWNLAYLAGAAADVPRHRHEQGVEIHLGYGELEGYTLLGDYRALVREGYAMAIPPGVPHGFKNTKGHPHYLPFIFGSKRLGGWGIVLDVEARPIELEELKLAEPQSAQLNHMLQLDREIERAASATTFERRPLIKPEATRRPETGGLALGIARVPPGGLALSGDAYRIVSVARGTGLARVGPAEQRVGSHDHFGIPAGMPASLAPIGNEPLVILEATLE